MENIRPTVAEVNLENIEFNINSIRKKMGKDRKILIAVKANAYGHGIVEVSKFAEERLKVDFLGVAITDEGVVLRKAGLKLPVLVFGGLLDNDVPYLFEHDLTPTLVNMELAVKINDYAIKNSKTKKVHINVDTGMGRIGFYHKEAFERIIEISKMEGIEIEGIYTHFPSSDGLDKSFMLEQVDKFTDLIQRLENSGIHFPFKHCDNSGAIIDSDNRFFNMVRPGVMIYGLYPSSDVDHGFPLKQAVCLKSKIAFIKQVEPGRTISYGRSYASDKETAVATIPIGYGDGYNRLLSNLGEVLVDGHRVPVIGRVTMDQIMIDLGEHPNRDRIGLGQEVVLYGGQRDEFISVEETAEKLNTITYEVTCWLSSRVPRKYYYRGNEMYREEN